jgi:hypothetical protein
MSTPRRDRMLRGFQLVVQLLSHVNKMKFQTPSTKLQTIPNFQNPNHLNEEEKKIKNQVLNLDI